MSPAATGASACSDWDEMSEGARPPSVALPLMGGLPEQLLPVAELRLHGAGAIEKVREVGDAAGLPGELQAPILVVGHPIVDVVWRPLRVLSQPSGGAPVPLCRPYRFV